MAGARVAVATIDMRTHSRGAPADGRGRRDPVHAGARRHDGGRGGRWRAAFARRPRARARPARSTSTTAPRCCRNGRRSRTCAAASTRGCARPSPAASGCPTSARTRSARPGATAVGARKPLVAFNVYLSGDRRRRRRRTIARAIRESSGGLPALRAIGFAVPERGCVTVSMNLVDHEVTGLVDRVRRRGGRGFRARPRCAGLRDRGARARRRRSGRGSRRTCGSPGSTRTRRSWSACSRRAT